jgi:hypothetical protein
MNYAKIAPNGSARDKALKRRNSAVREALRMGRKPEPIREPEQPVQQKAVNPGPVQSDRLWGRLEMRSLTVFFILGLALAGCGEQQHIRSESAPISSSGQGHGPIGGTETPGDPVLLVTPES